MFKNQFNGGLYYHTQCWRAGAVKEIKKKRIRGAAARPFSEGAGAGEKRCRISNYYYTKIKNELMMKLYFSEK